MRSFILRTLQHIQSFIVWVIPLEPWASFVISVIAVAEVMTHFTSMRQMQKQSTKCVFFSLTKGVISSVLIYVALHNEGKIFSSLF